MNGSMQPQALASRDDSLLSMEELDHVVGGLARPLMDDGFVQGAGPVGGAGLAHRLDPFLIADARNRE